MATVLYHFTEDQDFDPSRKRGWDCSEHGQKAHPRRKPPVLFTTDRPETWAWYGAERGWVVLLVLAEDAVEGDDYIVCPKSWDGGDRYREVVVYNPGCVEIVAVQPTTPRDWPSWESEYLGKGESIPEIIRSAGFRSRSTG